MVDTQVKFGKETREKAIRLFGSENAYQWFKVLNKWELNRVGAPHWAEAMGVGHWEATLTSRIAEGVYGYEEDYLEAAERAGWQQVPAWMRANTFLLREAPLGSLGWPEGYDEAFLGKDHRDYEDDDWAREYPRHREWRLPRRDGVSTKAEWNYYSSLGWPKSEGVPVRLVTPEEDKEIRRRLTQAGLAKAGSEVPVEGYRLDELLAANLPTPQWIINDFLREGGAAMIYAPSGVGKSWFAYTLLLGMATGKGFALKDTEGSVMLSAGDHEGKRVCLVDGEMLAADIADRISTLIKGLGLKPVVGSSSFAPIHPEDFRLAMGVQEEIDGAVAAIDPDHNGEGWEPEVLETAIGRIEHAYGKQFGAEENTEGLSVDLSKVLVYPRTSQDYRASMVSLVDKGSKSPIIEFAKRHDIDVFIFDNVATLSEGLSDENAASAFEPLNDLVVSLKREGVATVIVHHTGKAKDAKTYRGSSNLETVLEQTVRLEKVEGPRIDARFRVVVDKERNRGGSSINGKTMTLSDGSWIFEEDAHENASRVIEAIKTRKYSTQKQVGDALNLSQPTVSNAVKAGVVMGLVSSDTVVRTWFKEARDLAKGYGEVCQFDEADGDDL